MNDGQQQQQQGQPQGQQQQQQAAWYDGADAETVGYLQHKGWDKVDAKAAALASVKSYREAEKLIHAPPDQVVRWPKDASDAENWSKIHARLGVPADPKEYDFSTVKFADGTPLDDDFVTTMRAALKDAGVPKDRAVSVISQIAKLGDKQEAAEATEAATKLAAERDTLKINWGNNLTPNLMIAKAAAEKLGVKPEAVSALEGQIGYAAVMEMFRNIGVRMGEDKFITGNSGQNSGIMSQEGAQADLASKMADASWVAKLNAGDQTAKREFHNLTQRIAGVAA